MGRALLLSAASVPVALALAARGVPQPLILINPSPSVPRGLYIRTHQAPAVGRLLAFRTPAPGQAYVRAHLPELERGGILKPIVAGPGQQVCVGRGWASVDGQTLGPVQARDSRGAPLPQWRGCRRLSAGEFFVFSRRIWNSFDSRYYGPVATPDIVGVFAPLWLWDRTDTEGVA